VETRSQKPAIIGSWGFIISLNKMVAKDPLDNENSTTFPCKE